MSSTTIEGDLEYVRILEVDGRLFLLTTVDGQFCRARMRPEDLKKIIHEGMEVLVRKRLLLEEHL